MKQLVLKLIFVLGVLPALLVASFFHLNQNGFFNIQKVEVIVENPTAGQEQFLKPLVEALEKDVACYQDLSLWDIELRQVSDHLRQLEWIENSSVKRSWPTSLTVRVKPHEVKLLYLGKRGSLVPIIKSGAFLEAVDARRAPDVALLEGEVFAKAPELRKKAIAVMEEIPSEGAFSKKTISEIRYDKKEGFWMSLIKTGMQVKIGEDQVALKAARVSQVVDYLDNHQFDARVIDANLSKKVLVRLRKGP